MFHQFGVNQSDRNALRFLWWDEGNLDKAPTEYRMCVHLFGATSSPGTANFALKAVADEFESKYGEAAAEFVRSSFYVDDGIGSVDHPDEAITLLPNTVALCAERKLRLHKIVYNDRRVLESIPVSERGKSIQSLDLQHDELPIERTLGMVWHVQSDTFKFTIDLKDKPLSRQMNVPHASHMGGSWERMIGTARNVLSALLMNHGQQLDDELLRTLLT
ncbi:uncharacterized protein LOC135498392 [Lineus longissimus]|uniref:uncharacterized protein LOC135498392 n=1 Tax=Lineus longissimus TaxID=88925 RepID=UPI00315D24D1